MKRREFVSGVTAGAVTGLSGCLSGEIATGGYTLPEIKVKLFQTDEIADQSLPATSNEYVLTESKDLIEESFNTFSFDLEVNVEVSDVQISESNFTDAEKPLRVWSDLVEDDLSEDEKAKHCNMIFMERDIPTVAGRAEFPCDCGKPRSSVIYGASDLYYTRSARIGTSESFNTSGQRYPVVVHEIGHQIGLEHNMGSVIREDEDDQHVVTSAMLGAYAEELDDNYWDENAFSEYDSSWSVYHEASFNPRISRENFREVFDYS